MNLRSENYVAFFTVCGFFIGMIFSMVKFNGALSFLLATLTITLFFYLFIHIVLIFFLSAKKVEDNLFYTEDYESISNRQIAEIKEREDKITALLKSIHGTKNKDREGV
jgi:hypothetical protein